MSRIEAIAPQAFYEELKSDAKLKAQWNQYVGECQKAKVQQGNRLKIKHAKERKEFEDKLAAWKSLPFWKRWRTDRPTDWWLSECQWNDTLGYMARTPDPSIAGFYDWLIEKETDPDADTIEG